MAKAVFDDCIKEILHQRGIREKKPVVPIVLEKV